MSKHSPSKYENLEVANATLDAAEDRIELLEAQLRQSKKALVEIAAYDPANIASRALIRIQELG